MGWFPWLLTIHVFISTLASSHGQLLNYNIRDMDTTTVNTRRHGDQDGGHASRRHLEKSRTRHGHEERGSHHDNRHIHHVDIINTDDCSESVQMLRMNDCLLGFEVELVEYNRSHVAHRHHTFNRLCRSHEVSLSCIHDMFRRCSPTEPVLLLMAYRIGFMRDQLLRDCSQLPRTNTTPLPVYHQHVETTSHVTTQTVTEARDIVTHPPRDICATKEAKTSPICQQQSNWASRVTMDHMCLLLLALFIVHKCVHI